MKGKRSLKAAKRSTTKSDTEDGFGDGMIESLKSLLPPQAVPGPERIVVEMTPEAAAKFRESSSSMIRTMERIKRWMENVGFQRLMKDVEEEEFNSIEQETENSIEDSAFLREVLVNVERAIGGMKRVNMFASKLVAVSIYRLDREPDPTPVPEPAKPSQRGRKPDPEESVVGGRTARMLKRR
jgi:hypothetical protein